MRTALLSSLAAPSLFSVASRFAAAAAFATLTTANVACAPAAEPDASELAEDDAELRALASAEIVGTLAAGETKTVAYKKTPLYRALKMNLAAGAKVDLWVRSENGDARAWLLGSSFQTIALSSDASASDTSAHLERTVSKAGTYYVAFREEKLRDATFQVSLAGATPPPPPPPPPASDRCTSDAQCGGGAAMCFVDRCVTVRDETKRVNGLQRGASAAFASNGQLQVAYSTFQSTSGYPSSITTLLRGAFDSAGTAAMTSGGASSDVAFRFDRAPGLEPVLASTTASYNGDGVSFGGSGTALGYHESVRQFAVGRNRAGTQFVAMVASTPAPVNSYQSDKCTLRFAMRPAGGAWSNHEMVDTCSWGGYRSLAIHVRADGAADIVAAGEFGGVLRYHRENPIDPWAKTMLVASSGPQGRSAFAFAHGADGTTHLVAQPYEFTTSSSNGDYTATYLELSDSGIVRSTPLGTYREQFFLPFDDAEADAAGNVWLFKRPREMSDRAAVVRIDRRGTAVERSVGLMPANTGGLARLAVSPNGEIAVVSTAGYDLNVRRFTPIGR